MLEDDRLAIQIAGTNHGVDDHATLGRAGYAEFHPRLWLGFGEAVDLD